MKNLTRDDAIKIVVEAARSYAEIVAGREGKTHKMSAAEISQAIEMLESPPLFLPTFKPPPP